VRIDGQSRGLPPAERLQAAQDGYRQRGDELRPGIHLRAALSGRQFVLMVGHQHPAGDRRVRRQLRPGGQVLLQCQTFGADPLNLIADTPLRGVFGGRFKTL
jgi:hypothetical protein